MKCLFTGSFDPITNGHIDIINRLAKLYDSVYVGIAVNPDKRYMFSPELRRKFIENQITAKNVFPVIIDGLVSEFAYGNSIDVFARGIRGGADIDSEMSMASANLDMAGIESIFMPSRPELSNISSSFVKAITKERGDISKYVSVQVKHHVEYANGISVIGVVGNSGSGKSTFVDTLVDAINTLKIPPEYGYPQTRNAIRIDMDRLAHDIYTSTEPYASELKRNLREIFGNNVVNRNLVVDRKNLAKIVFNNEESLRVLNELMARPMQHALYTKLRSVAPDTTVFIDGAVIAENGLLPIVNNNVIHVMCDQDIAVKRIVARDEITAEQANTRIESQMNPHDRAKLIQSAIDSDGYGSVFTLDTTYIEDGKVSSELKRDIISVISKMEVPYV